MTRKRGRGGDRGEREGRQRGSGGKETAGRGKGDRGEREGRGQRGEGGEETEGRGRREDKGT